MKSLTIRFASLTLLFYCLVSHAQTSSAPNDVAAKLAVRVSSYDLDAKNFVDALMQTSSHFEIPMGIEWVDTPLAKARLARSWKNTTVQQILSGIIRTQRDYEFAVENGVFHVYSRTLIPSGQNFLRVKLGRFNVQHGVVEMASRNLAERVRSIVSPPKPQQQGGGVISSLGVNPDDSEISVELSDPTVRDTLDALVVASNRKIWIVTFSQDSAVTSTGFRRTSGLWMSSPVPDNDQPVWDLFHWGDAMPTVAAK
jgi:hypothetical protein